MACTPRPLLHRTLGALTERGGASLINTLSFNTPVNDCQKTHKALSQLEIKVSRDVNKARLGFYFFFSFFLKVQHLFLQNRGEDKKLLWKG